MNNEELPAGSPQANISPLRRVSGLWLIPLVTLLVGFWVAYENWASQGPLITIAFSGAEGLEEGKTRIKRRNIEIGHVVSLAMDENLETVWVTARMNHEVRKHLVEDSRFWVVKPSIGLSGVSGLDTLLSGQYIEFSPGSSNVRTRNFEALDKPPLTPPGTPGLHLTLNSIDNFSYAEGDAILYQGFRVGKVEDIFFNSSERMMYYNAFIESPYHELVTTNTRFWDVSGIRVEMTADGVAVQTSSLEALLLGGISFGLPEGEPLGDPVTRRAYYLIYPSHSASQEKHYEHAVSFILLVDDSVGGLPAGARVMMRGMQVGSVVRGGYIPEEGNLLDTSMQIPIRIEVHPGRLGLPDTEQGKNQAQAELLQWLGQGMSATLEIQNFLLGQQQVNLNFPESTVDSPPVFFDGLAVIPVKKNSFSEITDKLAQLVGKINDLQFAEIGDGLEQLLKETTATMQQVQLLAASGDAVLADAHQQALVRSLNDAVKEMGALAASYGADSPANRELVHLLQGMTETLSELKPLLTELNNKPNSLIFSGSKEEEQQPRRNRQ